jgi:hypothetical protein
MCTGCTVPAALRRDARTWPAPVGTSSKRRGISGPNETVAPEKWPDTTAWYKGRVPTLRDVSPWRTILVAGLIPVGHGTPEADWRPPGKCLLTVGHVKRLFVGKNPEAYRLQVSQLTDLTGHGGHCRANFQELTRNPLML